VLIQLADRLLEVITPDEAEGTSLGGRVGQLIAVNRLGPD
jgi:hypothetical protein